MIDQEEFYIPERLLHSFIDEGVVAFVGAGLSMNEGLPSWEGLMNKMLSELKYDISKQEYNSVERHIKKHNFLLAGDYLKHKLGDIRYKKFIEKTFLTNKIGKIHRLLTSIPFFGIVTTNYDDLISCSDVDNKFNSPFSWDDIDVYRKTKKSFILHAHGMASTPINTILSESDYNNLTFAVRNITFWEAIKNIFQTHRVLFIGYGLNDPDFNLFLAKLKHIFPGNLNEHHVLIAEYEQDLLSIYRLKEVLGVTPIRARYIDTIGETTYTWLKKLKIATDFFSETHNTGSLIGQDKINNFRILSLKEALSNILSEKYKEPSDIYGILDSIGIIDIPFNLSEVKVFWKFLIENLSDDKLRALSLSLISHIPNEVVLKRILSHLP